MEYDLMLSYGKDSIAAIEATMLLGLPLDRIIHVDVWATDTIPADLPTVMAFKAYADEQILRRYGKRVEHIRSEWTFERAFYAVRGGANRKRNRHTTNPGKIYGWPKIQHCWGLERLKLEAIRHSIPADAVTYVGIAADEVARHKILNEKKQAPLVMIGWTEKDCHRWCAENDLLSPIYANAVRSGCWFCPQQRVADLRTLYRAYPELWALMLKWDGDSPFSYTSGNIRISDYDLRFHREQEGSLPPGRFFWAMLKDAEPTTQASKD